MVLSSRELTMAEFIEEHLVHLLLIDFHMHQGYMTTLPCLLA